MSASGDSGARRVGTEVEVPGTPEMVWRAIATASGMAAWFVPAEVEEREGGRIVTHHGPYGASVGTVTAWDPPHRFAYEERDWLPGEDVPPWSTEFLVEARSGGTCVVRLVSGLAHDGQGWEEQLEGTEEGWRWGMLNLRLYLERFAGEPAANLWALRTVQKPRPDAHADLTAALGLAGVEPGQRFRAPKGVPRLSGTLELVEEFGFLLRTEDPWPGSFNVNTWLHDGVVVSVRAYLYGESAPEVVAREEPAWQAWLARHFALDFKSTSAPSVPDIADNREDPDRAHAG